MSFSFANLEKWFLEGIKDIEKYILPEATLAVSLIPGLQGIPAVTGIIAALPGLMQAMESALPANGQGALKQAGIMAVVKTVCDDADKLLPSGSTKTVFDQVAPVALSVIQTGMSLVNSKAPDIVDSASTTPQAGM